MLGEAKAVAPSVDEIKAITAGFSRIQFDERFGNEDIIIVKEAPVPIAEAKPAAVVAEVASDQSAARPRPPPPRPGGASAAVAVSAPPPPPPVPREPPKPSAEALYDYAPDGAEKIALVAGKVYLIELESDSGWWMIKDSASGTSGWAPTSYLKKH
jgi:hypothetical protein